MESKRRTAPTKLAVKGHYNYKAPLDGAEMMAANPYRPWSARITSMTPLTEKETLFELRLIDDRIRDAFHHKPGQFVCVSVFGVGEVPISISSSPSKSGFIEICVRRAGDVTSALHNMQCGDIVGLRGPYGHPFPFEDMKGHDILLVAGGYRPSPRRVPQVLAFLFGSALPIYFLNKSLNTNFYFLNDPYGNIITSTFTALLGEKYYILGFLPATALALLLMYLPWAADYKKKKRA